MFDATFRGNERGMDALIFVRRPIVKDKCKMVERVIDSDIEGTGVARGKRGTLPCHRSLVSCAGCPLHPHLAMKFGFVRSFEILRR